MKKQILTAIASFLTLLCFGQTDTIFSNNEQILCIVKEITPEAVKYSLVGEELLNSIYKNSVQKIVFKNGRVQVFAEATSFKKVSSVDDYELVTIAQVESEVKGLFKVGEVSAKAKGTTTLSNQERVKERAYRKLKIGAAMMGANIIYLTNQRTEGNKLGGYFESGSTAETNLTGIAYTNQLPNFEDFKSTIGTKKSFSTVEEARLWSSGSDMIKTELYGTFLINGISNENGTIIINGELDGDTTNQLFRLVSFDKEYFNIYYEDKSTIYNVKIKL